VQIQEMALEAGTFDLVYFDAFAPKVQPELWETMIFKKLYDALVPGGILVTYSSKGLVKRNLREAGFAVERLPGPAGKRHITRAVKSNSRNQ
jgi:tRNA U34 5-methylaminomethyl-2-thiouridine-forming methyltransferase MnmC